MSSPLPPLFLERLEKIVPRQYWQAVLDSFHPPAYVGLRINTLKISVDAAQKRLLRAHINFRSVPWCPEALVVDQPARRQLLAHTVFDPGDLYFQSLSSQLTSLCVDAQPHEQIIDMCCAPGSKLSHCAARMGNTGNIIALESVRSRYYKCRAVLNLLGVTNVALKCMDARRYNSKGMAFDKVLCDAPCSCESRFCVDDVKSLAYWKMAKVQQMRKKQKGLLLAAARCLRPGGVLVYATCTFAPEENEEVVDWLLKKEEGSVALIETPFHQFEGVRVQSGLDKWGKKTFDPSLKRCGRILPLNNMEAFFIARIVRKNEICS